MKAGLTIIITHKNAPTIKQTNWQHNQSMYILVFGNMHFSYTLKLSSIMQGRKTPHMLTLFVVKGRNQNKGFMWIVSIKQGVIRVHHSF